MSIDIYKLLFSISEGLDLENLMALKFLSLDHIPLRNQEDIQDPKDFFKILQEKRLIEEHDLSFLKELLFRVNRIDLLTEKLNSNRDKMERELQIPNRAKVSPYRQLLYRISEEITREEVDSVRFLLQKALPKKKIRDNVSILKLFIEMEKAGIMNATKLTVLKGILWEIRPDLAQKIDTYELKAQDSTKLTIMMENCVLTLGDACVTTIFHNPKSPSELITSLESPLQNLTITKGIATALQTMFRLKKNWIQAERGFTPLLILWQDQSISNSLSPCYIQQEVPCPKTCALVGPSESGATEGMSVPKLSDPYRMDNNPHGYCVILNNSDFKNPEATRKGAYRDAVALKQVFEWLQFQTIEHQNLEAKQIYEQIQKYSSMDHSNMDCFVCCLLSHGEKGKIHGTDWNSISIKDLVSCFTGSNCPSLAGKPKLFFIQACQGKTGQKSVLVDEDSSQELETDAFPLPSIPDWSDFLMGMATVEDFECYRDIKKGSAYIQCLCKEMRSLCPHREDLVTILTQVNEEIGQEVFQGRKQMPEIKSTLRKKLIFKMQAIPDN